MASCGGSLSSKPFYVKGIIRGNISWGEQWAFMDTSVLNLQKQLTDVRDGYYTITSKGHTVSWVWSLWLWLLCNYFIIIIIIFFSEIS